MTKNKSMNKNPTSNNKQYNVSKEIYNLRKSFVYAFSGILFCIRYERNMRIHIIATIYVLFTSICFYEHSKSEIILLILTCVLIMSLEIINTSIEVLTDKASPEYSILAKAAKDAAAGAVFIASIAAVIVSVILFWDVEKFKEISAFFMSDIPKMLILCLSFAFSVIFILTGKKRIKEKEDSYKNGIE